MRSTRKVALAVVAGVVGVALFGAAAMAAYVADVPSAVGSVIGSNAAADDDEKHDKIKDLLDGLVKKGVITQAQAEAILAALRDAAATHVKVEAVLRDFFGASAQYLGLSEKDLHAKLPGTSLAAIANGTPNHSRDGLVAAITKAASDDIDKALASKRISDDQAKKLRDELPNRVAAFVDRTWPKPTTHSRAPSVKGFLGDLFQAGQSYLGLPLADIRSQMASGKSLGDIANATPNKSREGLIGALTSAANARIDQAVNDKRITADQAATLKDKVRSEITTFADRRMPATTGVQRTTTAKP